MHYTTPAELVSLLRSTHPSAFRAEEDRNTNEEESSICKTVGGHDPSFYLISRLTGVTSPDHVHGMVSVYTGGKVLHKFPEKLAASGNTFGAISAYYDNARASGLNTEVALASLCEWMLYALLPRTPLIDFNYDSDPRSAVIRAREAQLENPLPNFNPHIVTTYVRSGHRVYATSADY